MDLDVVKYVKGAVSDYWETLLIFVKSTPKQTLPKYQNAMQHRQRPSMDESDVIQQHTEHILVLWKTAETNVTHVSSRNKATSVSVFRSLQHWKAFPILTRVLLPDHNPSSNYISNYRLAHLTTCLCTGVGKHWSKKYSQNELFRCWFTFSTADFSEIPWCTFKLHSYW